MEIEGVSGNTEKTGTATLPQGTPRLSQLNEGFLKNVEFTPGMIPKEGNRPDQPLPPLGLKTQQVNRLDNQSRG